MVIRALVLLALFIAGCAAEKDGLVPPTADQDPRLPQLTIEVAGVQRAIHVETHGDPASPVMLVMHGSLADYRALRPFSEFSDRYFVVLWDQRGNGLSERITAEEYTLSSIIDEIEIVRAQYAGARPATLVGHSFGAAYAVAYTSRHPEKVEQLVLLEPAALNGAILNETVDDLVNIDIFAVGLNEEFWSAELLAAADHEAWDYRALMLLLDAAGTNYHCDPSNAVELPVWRPGAYIEHLRPRQVLGYDRGDFDYDFTAGFDRYHGDVLIVASDCSVLGATFQQRWHVPILGSARVVTVPNAGHRLMVERWAAVRAATADYLFSGGPP